MSFDYSRIGADLWDAIGATLSREIGSVGVAQLEEVATTVILTHSFGI